MWQFKESETLRLFKPRVSDSGVICKYKNQSVPNKNGQVIFFLSHNRNDKIYIENANKKYILKWCLCQMFYLAFSKQDVYKSEQAYPQIYVAKYLVW